MPRPRIQRAENGRADFWVVVTGAGVVVGAYDGVAPDAAALLPIGGTTWTI